MTERCQNYATQNSYSQLYYFAVFIVILFLLVNIFSFTCSVFVFISYVGGCLACLGAIRCKENVISIFELIISYFCPSERDKAEQEQSIQNVCSLCDEEQCKGHCVLSPQDPWGGLFVHKQLDLAIEDFYNTILSNFVTSWYTSFSNSSLFVQELRYILRYSSSVLLRRAWKINYAHFILDKLVPSVLHHYTIYQEAKKLQERMEDISLEQAARTGPLVFSLHTAASSRDAELSYLRSITNTLMPYLLQKQDTSCRIFEVLIREIFAGWVLLSLTDVLADPHILNSLIILAASDEKMSILPTLPSHKVEFLEHFVSAEERTSYRKDKMLSLDLDTILKTPEYLYCFVNFMKSIGKLNLLQFCLDIERFNNRILKPDLPQSEHVPLFNDAWELYVTYFACEGHAYVPLARGMAEEVCSVLSGGAAHITQLQTCRALYQAYEYAYDTLQEQYVPKFCHSEEFYKLICGPRLPTGYNKQTKKPEKTLSAAAKISNQLNKLKDALKSQSIDGQILDHIQNNIKINTDSGSADNDSIESLDILRYLDTLAEHGRLDERDLSNCRISIHTSKDIKVDYKPYYRRLFTLSIERADPSGLTEHQLWTVERTDSDFHSLRAKLQEFHGEALTNDVCPPSLRSNIPIEILRYKYEDYVQRLLQKPLLRTSELLHLFLCADGDFALAVHGQGSSDGPNLYQSVAHKLRKEKGQHLDAFMNTFLLSTDVERYQAMKQVAGKDKELDELAEEASAGRLDLSEQRVVLGRPRCIKRGAFQDNFGAPQPASHMTRPYQNRIRGFTHCFLFLLVKVFCVCNFVIRVMQTLSYFGQEVLDKLAVTYLNRTLKSLLSQPRLAHLIKLGQGLLFGPKSSQPKWSPAEAQAEARRVVSHMEKRGGRVWIALAPNVGNTLHNLFEMIQCPALNKQLVYNLFDLCLAELFPELLQDGENITQES